MDEKMLSVEQVDAAWGLVQQRIATNGALSWVTLETTFRMARALAVLAEHPMAVVWRADNAASGGWACDLGAGHLGRGPTPLAAIEAAEDGRT